MARTRKAASTAKPPAPTPTWDPLKAATCPVLALHACLLLGLVLLKAQPSEDFPFQGTWPDIMWTDEARDAWLCTVAHRLVPPKHWRSRHALLAFHPRGRCLLAFKTGRYNQGRVDEEPDWLKGAYWSDRQGRWGFKLRIPSCTRAQRKALVTAVVNKFKGEGTAALRRVRAAEMRALLGRGTRDDRPWHAVHRI